MHCEFPRTDYIAHPNLCPWNILLELSEIHWDGGAMHTFVRAPELGFPFNRFFIILSRLSIAKSITQLSVELCEWLAEPNAAMEATTEDTLAHYSAPRPRDDMCNVQYSLKESEICISIRSEISQLCIFFNAQTKQNIEANCFQLQRSSNTYNTPH